MVDTSFCLKRQEFWSKVSFGLTLKSKTKNSEWLDKPPIWKVTSEGKSENA